MHLVHPSSLAATVDAVEGALFWGNPIRAADARGAARWIAGRQGLSGSYAGMFAPTARDWRGFRVFTGERLVTRAGLSHVLGETACCVLRRLGVRDAAAVAALARANDGMLGMLHRHAGADRGEYCCGPCSVAVWRHLAAGGLDAPDKRLDDGMQRLRAHRRADGTWRRFPFYYTLLALSELDGDLPLAEMRHAAARCERLLRRAAGRGVYDRRRRGVLERVVQRVG